MTSQASFRRKNDKSARKPHDDVVSVEELIRQLVNLLRRQNAALEERHDFTQRRPC
jgi:hypothetical protein